MNMQRRRALGQHFLKDAQVISAIVESVAHELQNTASRPCQTLLEIGPGKGALTRPLIEFLDSGGLQDVRRMLLVERDRELAERWKVETLSRKAMRAQQSLDVIEGDFMETPVEAWNAERLGVVSNLPYSAGTAIVEKLSGFPDRIAFMVLMFQAEVARRLRAEPGSRAFGSLTLWIGNRWDCEKLLAVPPEAFRPPPKVDSEVLILRPRSAPRILGSTKDAKSLKRWEQLIGNAFAQRRKMLRSRIPAPVLERAGIDGTKRAETLQWNEWQRLYDAAASAHESQLD